MFMKKSIRGISFGNIFVFILALVLPIVFSESAQAATFTQAYVRLDRLKTATPTTGMVCAKPATTSTGDAVDVQVTFPTVAVTNFTLSATGSDWNASTADIDGNTAWPGITAATPTVSGQTVTWTYASNQTLTAGTLYCFRWTTAALTTSAAGIDLVGNIKTRTTAGATVDSSNYSTAIVSDDQVVITAIVPPTFDFSLSGNTDTFTDNLSTTAQLSNGVTATIKTNAANGWIAWVKSANAALNSASTGASISTIGTVNNTVDTLTSSNYGYLLDVTFTDSGTGTGTVTQGAGYGQEYDGNSSNSGGTLSTSFQPIAASSGTTDNDTVVLKALARISAVQAAATDYTDTLTVVAAGRF